MSACSPSVPLRVDRILAAKQLGWSEVPTIAIEHLDAAQRRRSPTMADGKLGLGRPVWPSS
jgi:hypothetical protein